MVRIGCRAGWKNHRRDLGVVVIRLGTGVAVAYWARAVGWARRHWESGVLTWCPSSQVH